MKKLGWLCVNLICFPALLITAVLLSVPLFPIAVAWKGDKWVNDFLDETGKHIKKETR